MIILDDIDYAQIPDEGNTSSPETLSTFDEDRTFRFSAVREYQANKNLVALAEALLQDENGGIIKLGKVQEEILNFIIEHPKENLNIEAPVGIGKTNIISLYKAHKYIENRQHTCIYLSESDDVAEARLGKILNLFSLYSEMTGEKFKFSAQNTSSFKLIENKNTDVSMLAKNIESKYTGSHVAEIILDDVETVNTAPNIQKIIEEDYNKKVLNRLSKDGRLIAINTPYSIDGLLTKLEDEPGWLTLKISMKEELVKEHLLDHAKNLVNSFFTDEAIRNQAIRLLDRKLIFDVIELVEESKIEGYSIMSKSLRDLLDFSYTKQIIKLGEVIDEEELVPWDFLVRKEGKQILNKWLTSKSAYLMTYALNPALGLATNIFTSHREAIIDSAEYLKLIKDNSTIKVFSYDLSSIMRAGTVITETTLVDNTAIIISQREENRSSDSIKENIQLNPNAKHIIEANGMQGEIIRVIEKELSEIERKNIIRHYTTSEKNDMIRGVNAMNQAFKNREILFLEGGNGIDALLNMLSSYTGKKTKKQQYDRVDGLYFIASNKDRISRTNNGMQTTKNAQPRRMVHQTRGVSYL